MSVPLYFCEVAGNSSNPELEDLCVLRLSLCWPHGLWWIITLTRGPSSLWCDGARWGFKMPSRLHVLNNLDFLECSPTNTESLHTLRVPFGKDIFVQVSEPTHFSVSGFRGKNCFPLLYVKRELRMTYCVLGAGKAWELWYFVASVFLSTLVHSIHPLQVYF